LDNSLQRDIFSVLVDCAAESTRKCSQIKKHFSSSARVDLVAILLKKLLEFEDVSQQQVPAVELLFRITPTKEPQRTSFLERFSPPQVRKAFNDITAANFLRNSRVFLVILNKTLPSHRLYPNIVGCKKIQASKGGGVFKDIAVHLHPLDLNLKGFFVPSKDQDNIPELDMPFEKMLR
jgi:hypothetical protein